MPSAAALAALRTWLLADAGVAAAVGTRVYTARADVAGVVPAVALELDGGAGSIAPTLDSQDVAVSAWSSVSWAEALAALDAVAKRCNLKTVVDGLPSPLLNITRVGSARQVSEQDYYHAQLTLTVIVRGG